MNACTRYRDESPPPIAVSSESGQQDDDTQGSEQNPG